MTLFIYLGEITTTAAQFLETKDGFGIRAALSNNAEKDLSHEWRKTA
jgi:hypothetical protein